MHPCVSPGSTPYHTLLVLSPGILFLWLLCAAMQELYHAVVKGAVSALHVVSAASFASVQQETQLESRMVRWLSHQLPSLMNLAGQHTRLAEFAAAVPTRCVYLLYLRVVVSCCSAEVCCWCSPCRCNRCLLAGVELIAAACSLLACTLDLCKEKSLRCGWHVHI